MTRTLAAGEDSFLDIVANLVGILIILVVVVGAQASRQLQVDPDEVAAGTATVDRLRAELEADMQATRNVQLDRAALERQIRMENAAAAALTDRRHRQLVELEELHRERESLKVQLAARWETLDSQQRESRLAQQAWEEQRLALEQELARRQEELRAVEARSGLSTGYDRTGRIVPLGSSQERTRALERSDPKLALATADRILTLDPYEETGMALCLKA